MRGLRPAIVLLAVALAGCATPPPKIEGYVSSVSSKDIEEIVELVHKDMVRDFGHVVPIDRIEIRDHNNVVVYYHRTSDNYYVPMKRVRGGWSLPTVTVTA